MKSAQATFQRMVNTVIKNLDFSLTYVYNLILCSDSCEDHLTHLYHTFGRLSQSDLTVILGRLIFFQTTAVDNLGHIVGQGRVNPVMAKSDAVMK